MLLNERQHHYEKLYKKTYKRSRQYLIHVNHPNCAYIHTTCINLYHCLWILKLKSKPVRANIDSRFRHTTRAYKRYINQYTTRLHLQMICSYPKYFHSNTTWLLIKQFIRDLGSVPSWAQYIHEQKDKGFHNCSISLCLSCLLVFPSKHLVFTLVLIFKFNVSILYVFSCRLPLNIGNLRWLDSSIYRWFNLKMVSLSTRSKWRDNWQNIIILSLCVIISFTYPKI